MKYTFYHTAFINNFEQYAREGLKVAGLWASTRPDVAVRTGTDSNLGVDIKVQICFDLETDTKLAPHPNYTHAGGTVFQLPRDLDQEIPSDAIKAKILDPSDLSGRLGVKLSNSFAQARSVATTLETLLQRIETAKRQDEQTQQDALQAMREASRKCLRSLEEETERQKQAVTLKAQELASAQAASASTTQASKGSKRTQMVDARQRAAQIQKMNAVVEKAHAAIESVGKKGQAAVTQLRTKASDEIQIRTELIEPLVAEAGKQAKSIRAEVTKALREIDDTRNKAERSGAGGASSSPPAGRS